MKLLDNQVFNLLFCLSLTICTLLGCSSPKPQDRPSTGFPTPNLPTDPNSPLPGFGNTGEDFGSGGLTPLNAIVMYAIEAEVRSEDRYNKRIVGQSINQCFSKNDIAIRFPSQDIRGQKVIDWNLVCTDRTNNPGNASFGDCNELTFGGKRPSHIGIDETLGSVTYFYDDVPDGAYEFIARAVDAQGGIVTSQIRRPFAVCAD